MNGNSNHDSSLLIKSNNYQQSGWQKDKIFKEPTISWDNGNSISKQQQRWHQHWYSSAVYSH